MRQVPHMIKLNDAYGSKGVQIVGISLDRSLAAMKSVVQQQNMNWTHVHDAAAPCQAVWRQRHPQRVHPQPDGVVRWNGHPAQMDEPLAQFVKQFPPQLVDPKVVKAARESLGQAAAEAGGGRRQGGAEGDGADPRGGVVGRGTFAHRRAAAREARRRRAGAAGVGGRGT
jgi:hypothetical protein